MVQMSLFAGAGTEADLEKGLVDLVGEGRGKLGVEA